jgi:pimeloyl-ACP methyl ester carboxylesterase
MQRKVWAGAAVVAALACSAPPDAGRTRPETVRATPFEQRDARVLGLRVRYIDVGPTEPTPGPPALPLMLIPGHTSRVEEYDAMVPALARRHRVVVTDYPGSGWAEKPDREYSLRLYEDVSIALLDQLGIGEALLAGGSQGGNLVLRLGHRFPERFPRLAPWAPGSAWDAQPRVARLTRAVRSYALFWPIVWVQSRFWYGPDWPGRDAALAETFAYYREVMGPGFVRMYFEMAADQVGRSLFDLAPAIDQPVWLGWGDQDDGANMGEGVARLCKLLPRCELRVFPGARHSLAAEVPDELAAAVAEFLDRHASTAAAP